MGEMAEYLNDLAVQQMLDGPDEIYIDEYEEELYEDYDKHNLYWVTKDGQEILIQDMTTSHIKNSIKFIKKRDDVSSYSVILEILHQELKTREYRNNQLFGTKNRK